MKTNISKNQAFPNTPISYSELHGGGNFFSLRVQDDCMVLADIRENDTVIFREQTTISNDDIAVVLIEGNVAIRKFHQENDIIHLVPLSSNPEYKEQTFTVQNANFEVIGKVIERQRCF